MAVLYVATSKNLAEWSSDVGLGKHVYKVGVAEGSAKEAVEGLNAESYAGMSDWKLVKHQPAEGLEESAALQRLGRSAKSIDPAYYPRIRGAVGLFRVKPDAVQNFFLVRQAMAGEATKLDKVKPADIAAYLLLNAAPEQE